MTDRITAFHLTALASFVPDIAVALDVSENRIESQPREGHCDIRLNAFMLNSCANSR